MSAYREAVTGTGETHRGPGRPRDADVGPAILAAARRLVGELGYEAVTTRMIADAAGAGKQTLYRRWPSKAELVLEAFLTFAEAQVDGPSAGASIHDELAGFLRRTFAALQEAGSGVRGLMAAAQHDAAFRQLFRTRFIEPRRHALAALLTAATRDGRLPPDTDVEAMTIAVFGAVWYRLLLDESLDDAFAGRLADILPRPAASP